jgi:hypothetical protein
MSTPSDGATNGLSPPPLASSSSPSHTGSNGVNTGTPATVTQSQGTSSTLSQDSAEFVHPSPLTPSSSDLSALQDFTSPEVASLRIFLHYKTSPLQKLLRRHALVVLLSYLRQALDGGDNTGTKRNGTNLLSQKTKIHKRS